jgi:hypothetical protein
VRDPQDCRDLGQRQPEKEVQGNDRPVTWIEAPERLVDELSIGQGARWIGRRWRVEGGQLDLDRPASSPTRKVETGVDREAVEPGVEPLGIAKAGQVAPGSDEALLDRVARELRMAKAS